MTKHLSEISPEWKSGPGVGKSVSWPTGIGSKGNPGVAFTIDQTPGAIGYLEYSYTVYSKTPDGHAREQRGEVRATVDRDRTGRARRLR